MTVKHLAHYKKNNYLTISTGTSVNALTLNAPFFNTEPLTSFTYSYLGVEIVLNVTSIGPSTTQNSVLHATAKAGWNGTAWSGAIASSPQVQGIITGIGTISFSNSSSLTSNIVIPILYTGISGQMDIGVYADVYTVYSS